VLFLPACNRSIDQSIRRELFALWKAFDKAKVFETKVDARLLIKNPLLRDDGRYRRYMT